VRCTSQAGVTARRLALAAAGAIGAATAQAAVEAGAAEQQVGAAAPQQQIAAAVAGDPVATAAADQPVGSAPPKIRSAQPPARTRSFPFPAQIRSSPAKVRITSSPPIATTTSLPRVPTSRSGPGVPTIVAGTPRQAGVRACCTRVDSVARSLPRTGSTVGLETLAESVIRPGRVGVPPIAIVGTVAAVPTPIPPTLQVTVRPLTLQLPAEDVAEEARKLCGSLSTTVTSRAGLGPQLVTLTV
jgi:hypothetical protein